LERQVVVSKEASRIAPTVLTVGKIVMLLVALDAFFVSIKLLGAFKDLGMGYGEQLIVDLACNPAIGLLIGILVTSVIQSSSTTTSLVVGLAAGGVFGEDPIQVVKMAVPIVMGANIGTTITSVLVSLGHLQSRREFKRAFNAAIIHDFFNLLAVCVWFPIQASTNIFGRASVFLANAFADVGGLTLISPVSYLVDPQHHLVTEFFKAHRDAVYFVVILTLMLMAFGLIRFLTGRYYKERPTVVLGFIGIAGFSACLTLVIQHPQYIFIPETAIFLCALGTLFLSLFGIVKLMRSMIIERVERLFHDVIFKSDLRALLLGLVLTALVQSSSVTISMAVPLAGAGIIVARNVFPYALGANVGTTVTALMAALAGGQTVGLAIAFAHFLFNVSGIAVWYPLRKFPLWLAAKFADVASRSRVVPILYIVAVYLLLPLVLIAIMG
jgi:sodium-dependent phosphate cotransporter